jgi:hypothetical protein
MQPCIYLLLIQTHGIVDGIPCYLAKNCVFSIEVIAAIHCDEELAVVGVWGILIGTGNEAPARYRRLVKFVQRKGQGRY